MISRFLSLLFRKALQEALSCPLARIEALEDGLVELERSWKTASDELDATYRKVHSELGHISRQKRLVEETNGGERKRPRVYGALPYD